MLKLDLGPLRIYRVMKSVAFLNSGNVVQPMLPKSQCWCVDGVSKFVMRIRGMSFYRIELPCETSDDKIQVDLLKSVLENVLQYEKTSCPFKRSFTVELPEPPETPIKKVPWRPKIDHRMSSPDATTTSPAQGSRGVKDGQILATRKRPISTKTQAPEAESPPKKVADFPDEHSEGDSSAGVDQEDHYFSKNGIGHLGLRRFGEIKRHLDSPANANVLESESSGPTEVIAPTSVATPGTSHHVDMFEDPDIQAIAADTQSDLSSPESFYSTLSSSKLRSPSLESSADAPASNRQDVVKKEPVESSRPPHSSPLWDLSDTTSLAFVGRTGSLPSTRTIGPSIETCKPGLRVRRELEKRRTISPMPSSTNLAPPYSPSQQEQLRHLTNTLLQRTCFYLIQPPLHLLALMIRVAIQITRGSLQGSMDGLGERGERIPCSWDFSSDSSDASNDTWDEDDYGVKLSHTVSGRDMSPNSSGTWEID